MRQFIIRRFRGASEVDIMEHKQKKKVEYEIDLFEVLKAVLSHWWLIFLAMVVGAALLYAYTYFFVVPEYESSVSFYVNNGQRTEDKISTSDISASQSLVDTYIVILKYGTTLDAVIVDAKLDCTTEELLKKIKCSSINDTEVFQVTVSDASAERATKIAQSIERILPDKVSEVIEGSTVRIVRNPSVPTSPSSPNLLKNLLFGAVAGFVLCGIYLVLRYILDDRIRDAAQMLKDTYPYPVLAVIPDLMSESKGYYYAPYTRRNDNE